MSKEHIEEMAKVIKSSLDGLGNGNFNFTGDEISIMFAKAIYAADYRKQSEGKWKPYKDYFTHRQIGWICTNCSAVTHDLSNGDTDYCPHCGAVMETETEEKE